jgi:hypothetical protein
MQTHKIKFKKTDGCEAGFRFPICVLQDFSEHLRKLYYMPFLRVTKETPLTFSLDVSQDTTLKCVHRSGLQVKRKPGTLQTSFQHYS